MQQEAAFSCKQQGVHDTQVGVRGVRGWRLADVSASGSAIPLCPKITSPHAPDATARFYLDFDVVIAHAVQRRDQLNITFPVCVPTIGDKTGITVRQPL